MYAPVTIIYIYIYILDLDLEQVARQDKRYRARTSPPGRSLGFKSAKIKMQPRSKITMFLQSKASDKCEEFAVVECDVLRSVQVVVEVVVLDVERSCSRGEQRDEKGASRGTRKREGRRRKRKGKGKKKKKEPLHRPE